jgi:hypothetical protein
MWQLFKTFFKAQHRALKKRVTSGNAGLQANYGQLMDSMQANNDAHMVNMAEAHLMTSQHVTTLMSSIAALTAQVQTLQGNSSISPACVSGP